MIQIEERRRISYRWNTIKKESKERVERKSRKKERKSRKKESKERKKERKKERQNNYKFISTYINTIYR
jgi:hypothetical protein